MKKPLPVADCVSVRHKCYYHGYELAWLTFLGAKKVSSSLQTRVFGVCLLDGFSSQRKTVAETRAQALGAFPQAMAWGSHEYKGTNSRNFFNSFFNGENTGVWGGVVRKL